MFVCMHMVTKFPASTKMRRKIERKNGKRQREQYGGKMQNLYLYMLINVHGIFHFVLFAFHSSEQRHKKTRADKLSDDLFFLYRYFVQIKCVSYLGTVFLVASRNFYYWIFFLFSYLTHRWSIFLIRFILGNCAPRFHFQFVFWHKTFIWNWNAETEMQIRINAKIFSPLQMPMRLP